MRVKKSVQTVVLAEFRCTDRLSCIGGVGFYWPNLLKGNY